jgi:hypothetical protein
MQKTTEQGPSDFPGFSPVPGVAYPNPPHIPQIETQAIKPVNLVAPQVIPVSQFVPLNIQTRVQQNAATKLPSLLSGSYVAPTQRAEPTIITRGHPVLTQVVSRPQSINVPLPHKAFEIRGSVVLDDASDKDMDEFIYEDEEEGFGSDPDDEYYEDSDDYGHDSEYESDLEDDDDEPLVYGKPSPPLRPLITEANSGIPHVQPLPEISGALVGLRNITRDVLPNQQSQSLSLSRPILPVQRSGGLPLLGGLPPVATDHSSLKTVPLETSRLQVKAADLNSSSRPGGNGSQGDRSIAGGLSAGAGGLGPALANGLTSGTIPALMTLPRLQAGTTAKEGKLSAIEGTESPAYLPNPEAVAQQKNPDVDMRVGRVTSDIQNLPSGVGILDLSETDLESTPDAPFYEERGGLDLSGREKVLPLPTENLILDVTGMTQRNHFHESSPPPVELRRIEASTSPQRSPLSRARQELRRIPISLETIPAPSLIPIRR